jgi:hypothetical protein
VVDAPRLERLIHSQGKEGCTPYGSSTKVKIGRSPKLQFLGYLELNPGSQVLMVGNAIIQVPNLSIFSMSV